MFSFVIKALEVKRLKLLQKNLDCSSVFQEVESGRWLRVEDVDLAMPHPGTPRHQDTLTRRLDFLGILIFVDRGPTVEFGQIIYDHRTP